MSLRYWIQRHDYSTEEFDAPSVQAVVDAFASFDWTTELEAAQMGEDERDCPPGLGLHDGFGERNDATLLHICPRHDGTVDFNLHWPVAGKILGLFPTTKHASHFGEGIARDRVGELVEAVFAADPERLRRF